MAWIVHNPGAPDETTFALEGEETTVGRAEDQAICVRHRSLSRSHARIERRDGRFFVVDLESKNGTRVNGARVQREELRHGDTVTVGDVALLFMSEPGPRPPPEPRAQVVVPLRRAPVAALARDAALTGTVDRGLRAQARLQMLIEVAKLLPVSDDLGTMLGTILDMLFEILDVDRGVILLVDEATGKLAPRARRTARPSSEEGPIFSQRIVDHALRESAAVLFADAAADPRLDAAESVLAQSIRASMCVPMMPRDRLLGVLYVDSLSAPHLFTAEDLDFLAAFAGQAAVAIENAALHRRLEREAVARTRLIMEAKLASLGALVAGIAHELRNPLNFVTNFGEIASEVAAELRERLRPRREPLPSEELADLEQELERLQDTTARIAHHGRRADAIIESMRQHARERPGERAATDLNAVIAESVRLALRRAPPGGREVRVEEHYDPAVGAVEVAALDMGRVFMGLADNALQAMRRKERAGDAGYTPELRVRTLDRGDAVEVRVRDNGEGIPEEHLNRVFEPFFTTLPPGQGAGLGLSLSHDIVVMGHHGSIRLESAPGEHTEVVITLPRQGALTAPSPR